MRHLPGFEVSALKRVACPLLIAGFILSGCAGASGPSQSVSRGYAQPQLYAENVAIARQAQAEGHLREALWRWRIAEAVAPSRKEAAQQAEQAQARLVAAADNAEQEGDRAAKAGREAEARSAYTRAIELDPQRAHARAFLRASEAKAVTEDMTRHSGSSPVRRDARSSSTRHRARPKPS